MGAGQKGGMRLLVCSHNQTAQTGVHRLAVDPGDYTTSGLAEGDPAAK